jgi:hypothetical protein
MPEDLLVAADPDGDVIVGGTTVWQMLVPSSQRIAGRGRPGGRRALSGRSWAGVGRARSGMGVP